MGEDVAVYTVYILPVKRLDTVYELNVFHSHDC